MTTEIRDGVEWKPWWVRYAEIDGLTLALSDDDKNGCLCSGTRYSVAACPAAEIYVAPCEGCGAGLKEYVDHLTTFIETDDFDQALAAFHEAEEKLLRGELA